IDLNRHVRFKQWRHRQILRGGGGVGGRVAHRHLVVAVEQPRLEDAAVVGCAYQLARVAPERAPPRP
ncbi:hypothetical protein Taro_002518, partial [Colocasia esculenta]|nr:hypothetical protein [Colocasia esculenta]